MAFDRNWSTAHRHLATTGPIYGNAKERPPVYTDDDGITRCDLCDRVPIAAYQRTDCPDCNERAIAQERPMHDPRIKQTIVRNPNGGHLLVSTCNTSDHGLETMVFRAVIDWTELDCQRYDTVPEAIAGHDAMVKHYQEKGG